MDETRIIVHCDLDAFYAAVETLHHGFDEAIPLVIGSDPEGGRGRGIVSTCNYAARNLVSVQQWQLVKHGEDVQVHHMALLSTSEVVEVYTQEHLVK